ncbi:hypothetical protein D9M68_983470 [compost metagenome]
MARLPLDDQARSHALSDAEYVAMSDAELGELDQVISECFERLIEQGGESGRTFGGRRSNYRFSEGRRN